MESKQEQEENAAPNGVIHIKFKFATLLDIKHNGRHAHQDARMTNREADAPEQSHFFICFVLNGCSDRCINLHSFH